MRTFNRIMLVIVLVAVFIFGLFTAIYTFAGSDQYLDWGLPAVLALPEDAQPIQDWVAHFERGSIPVLSFVIVILAGLAGLLLLVLELLPRRRRYISLGRDARVERTVVEKQAEEAALRDEGVLDATADVRPRRRKASKLVLRVTARQGEDPRQVEQTVSQSVREAIVDRGDIRLAGMPVKARTIDPRRAKRRVR